MQLNLQNHQKLFYSINYIVCSLSQINQNIIQFLFSHLKSIVKSNSAIIFLPVHRLNIILALFSIFCFFLTCLTTYSQELELFTDSTSTTSKSSVLIDSLSEARTNQGLDTILTYTAKDTVIYSFKNKRMTLLGEAGVNYQNRKLSSEQVRVEFGESIFIAEPKFDSITKRYIGIPKFSENGEEYTGALISYNYKTNKGVIKKGETQISEGYYYGEKIKRVNQTDFYIKDGYYTTCDAPNPHFYFGSPRMKMVANEEIFLDPLIFYVADFPIFTVPFGLFFPTKSGRSSGLIVPSFFFSKDRGIVFQNFGFYWAASDYYDLQLTSNIYTKGGYVLKNTHRWALSDHFSGNTSIEYGYTRFNPTSDYTKVWKVLLNHDQTITPQQKLTVALNLSSNDYNRNTSTNLRDRIEQNISSNASYFVSFDNQTSLSVSYNREQNIITDEYRQVLPITYNIPNLRVAKIMGQDLNFSLRSSANYTNNKIRLTNLAQNGNPTTVDTAFNLIENKNIIHSPNISYNFPKLWNILNITPSINLNANNFFKKMDRHYNNQTKQVEENYQNGFFTEYWSSYAINLQTRFFGVMDNSHPLLGFIKPEALGFKAFRHTAEPAISLSYSKNNISNDSFYGQYVDSTGRTVTYSRFEKEGGSHSPISEILNLGFSLRNKFEIKIAQNDTLPDKNLELLQLDFNGGYNFVLDSNKMSLINLSFRTPALTFVRLQGSAILDIMDYSQEYDPNRNEEVFRRLDRLAILSGKSLAKLNSFNLSLSTDFSSKGVGLVSGNEEIAIKRFDSLNVGERFSLRQTHSEFDQYGDCSPGYQDMHVPWSVNIGLNYSYNKITVQRSNESFSVNLSSNIDLTQSWKITFDAIYDIVNKNFNNTTFNITKDLHCWSLSARWYPIGINQGFYLRFGIKASQLQDLKLEKQSNPLFR